MTDRHVGRLDAKAFPGAPLRFAALTDVGRVREQNEDACGVSTRAEGPLPVEALMVAADGVGGHVGGAVASRFVVDAVRDTFASQEAIDDLGSWMETLLQSIHRELLREAKGRGIGSAMGSTATVAAIDGTRLVLAHVGDSRAYRLRDGTLQQLTRDDSWVAEQMRAGVLTPQEMATNPQKNVLTQCLGIGESLRVHLTEERLEEGDRYLLCSDGLHGEVTDDALRDVLGIEADPGIAAERLVALANASGGPDNITAVVFDIGTGPGTRPGVAKPERESRDDTLSVDSPVESYRPAGPLRSAPRQGAGWVIAAGVAVLVTAGAAGAWSMRQPTGAATPATTDTLTVDTEPSVQDATIPDSAFPTRPDTSSGLSPQE